MRLVIDMQGAQTSSRFRGIGRYTMSLVNAMARLGDGHEILLALNGAYPDTIDLIRAAYAGLLPADAIRVWEPFTPSGGPDVVSASRRQVSEMMREAFFSSLSPDVVLVTSLFEGFRDEAITSINAFTGTLPTAVILYDLIPLIHRDTYLSEPDHARWYYGKLDHLRRADLLLSISASAGQEAIDWLNFPQRHVVNISSACDEHFRPMPVTNNERTHLQAAYGITRPFVMYTGGIDHRKNIEGLIRAFAQLPPALRHAHQLAVVCSIHQSDRECLIQLARESGLADGELVLTGYVPEADLLRLYNACTLFVFPSWHEGLGLPALEAMACGRAVIAANSSSLPEVIGRQDALFAPHDDAAVAAKMTEVLENPAFRTALEQHGLDQARKFSWDESARRAWTALTTLHQETQAKNHAVFLPSKRPRLAFVSPLPPEKTGIADYSAELLPELARHYDITVIVEQNGVEDPWIQANTPIHDSIWLRANAHRFDRIVYQFGNSPLHAHMFDLLAEIPGVVVLHDFYLSGTVLHRDQSDQHPHEWARALLDGHGWKAVQARYLDKDWGNVVRAYPCNLAVLQQALGIIVHSGFSRQLAHQFYGEGVADDWQVIPHLRATVPAADRNEARRKLNLMPDEFLVCSFGFLAPAKLNHRLLDAWLASPLAADARCRLVFVGENDGGDYGQGVLDTLKNTPPDVRQRINITGWADGDAHRLWLAAADVGVQLRALSRGETSGAVLDCMNHGLATIVNAHGSMAELPGNAVWMLPDAFDDRELVEALTTLWRDDAQRDTLGKTARAHIRAYHNPRRCAEHYFESIEAFHARSQVGLNGLLQAIPAVSPPLPPGEWPSLAETLAVNFPPHPRRKQILLDVSQLAQLDVKTGIHRVTRALLQEIALNPPEGFQVEPVHASTDCHGYRYARRFMSRFLGIPQDWAEDAPVQVWSGDIFLGLDLQYQIAAAPEEVLQTWRQRGAGVYFVVYDLLPVSMPEVFSEDMRSLHHQWLTHVTRFDGALAISRAVADELDDWLHTFGENRDLPFALHWFHLGADTENSAPTRGLPDDADAVLNTLTKRPSFLMVGTIEPRKGHAQTLDAFELLWRQGVEINLVIVGKQNVMAAALTKRLYRHAELGKRLFWLEATSDEYLEKIYAFSTCLLAASYGEGFGLPIIEAAKHGLPLIVRDIPIFREVTAGYACLFPDSHDPQVIAQAIQDWLVLYRNDKHPRTGQMPHHTWKDSARQALDALMGVKPAYKTWVYEKDA